jgi:predicted lipid carrier protein YhbT
MSHRKERNMRFHIPPRLTDVISHLPSRPPSAALAGILTLALRDTLARGDLQPLEGKHIAIRVIDLGVHVHFTVTAGVFRTVSGESTPDLALCATLADFVRLARREEDPDALFFSRRLVMEGDTELGLFAKNALDAIDFPKIPWPPPSPQMLLRLIRTRLSA